MASLNTFSGYISAFNFTNVPFYKKKNLKSLCYIYQYDVSLAPEGGFDPWRFGTWTSQARYDFLGNRRT